MLVRTDRLGDVILTLPMLPPLRSCFPDAFIAMLLNRYTGEIVEGNPYADELLWYDDGRELIPFREMLQTVRAKSFDAVIIVHPTPRLAWLMFRSGISLRIGTGYRYYSFLFNRKVYEHRKDAKRHELEYNLNLLHQLDCPLPQSQWRPEFYIDIPMETQHYIEGLLQSFGVDLKNKIVIIHPGSGGSAREWPLENFGMLAGKLTKERNVQIIVTGSEGEKAQVEEVVKCTQGNAIALAGKLRLKELAALIRSASLFVSNSTGPLHIAVAVGTPVVGLYPQITAMGPQRWGPYTDVKRVLVPEMAVDCTECSGNKGELCACMASITVEQVYEAGCSLLANNNIHAAGMMIHE